MEVEHPWLKRAFRALKKALQFSIYCGWMFWTADLIPSKNSPQFSSQSYWSISQWDPQVFFLCFTWHRSKVFQLCILSTTWNSHKALNKPQIKECSVISLKMLSARVILLLNNLQWLPTVVMVKDQTSRLDGHGFAYRVLASAVLLSYMITLIQWPTPGICPTIGGRHFYLSCFLGGQRCLPLFLFHFAQPYSSPDMFMLSYIRVSLPCLWASIWDSSNIH